MAHFDFTTPVSEDAIRKLRVNDTVTLGGTLFGIRDATQIHMALVTGFQGWMYRNAGPAVRLLLISAGFLLVYPEWWSRIAGFCLIAVSMAVQIFGRRRALA